ncbi:hypothetical protein Desti_5408 [Desulfomonile tiedjei DSM 6799]|uniref:Uncharacterized protein n=1 Tax=Desulfomonile tiedjei (strain ATCC 49306 / DSM 6799 / DCB-1) TaxID=706587 RepID=I4CEK4_DESTA|nr:hypothetical protein Desti_5408 [Desulfomonile tiedjei DSM 6799]
MISSFIYAVLESNHGLTSREAIFSRLFVAQFCQSGATDLSTLRSVLGASSGKGTDLALPGQWHPRHNLGLLLNVGTRRENF